MPEDPAAVARSASVQLGEALRQHGYRAVETYVSRGHRTETLFTYWVRDTQTLLLCSTTTLAGEELACELYQPLAQSNSIADTIAAIP
jgi:hypothetical protein